MTGNKTEGGMIYVPTEDDLIESRINCTSNSNQGSAMRVLCVCRAGLLRSPTVAWVLSNAPFNFNTRSAGLDPVFALVLVDDVLLHWAHLVVCMEESQMHELRKRLNALGMTNKHVYNFALPDHFDFKDPELIDLAKKQAAKFDLVP